jgi:hypothetical protein
MEDEDGNPLIECHKQETMDQYVWSMDILEWANLESKKGDHVDKHQSYILEEPQDPRLHEKSPESIFPCAIYTYESCNHLATILCSSVITSSRGWMWMLLSITSIPKLVVALAQVLAVETAKVELMT